MSLSELSTRYLPNGNVRLAATLAAVVGAMVGMSFAAVPLYSLFCQVTGFAGTTQRATSGADTTIPRRMTVRFDANVARDLPWRVEPAQSATNRVGAVDLATYRVTNMTGRTITGTAGFNVTPESAGIYFNKIECFCFTEQTLGPGESTEMSVSYFVDPDIDTNDELDTVREITLSYTFYRAENQGS